MGSPRDTLLTRDKMQKAGVIVDWGTIGEFQVLHLAKTMAVDCITVFGDEEPKLGQVQHSINKINFFIVVTFFIFLHLVLDPVVYCAFDQHS